MATRRPRSLAVSVPCIGEGCAPCGTLTDHPSRRYPICRELAEDHRHGRLRQRESRTTAPRDPYATDRIFVGRGWSWEGGNG